MRRAGGKSLVRGLGTGRDATGRLPGRCNILRTTPRSCVNGFVGMMRGAGGNSFVRGLCTGRDATERRSDRGKILVTTPIYYVNGAPHIGHAFSSLLCDAFARWQRMKGRDVVFSTGTDEHGAKVEKAAKNAGFDSCKEFCDSISKQFEKSLQDLGVSHDVFIRTTDENHKITVSNIWERLMNSQSISKGSHSGWYCQSDEAFLTEKEVCKNESGEMVSLESGHTVEWLEESNYVFSLAKFKDVVVDWLDTGGLVPNIRSNEMRTFVQDEALGDLSVSRPRERVGWAIPVPNDTTQSIYVWLDALSNYLTVAGVQIHADPSKPISWRDANVEEIYHVVGKDITRFHTIYWPSFLGAAGLELPTKVIAHGHWTVDRTKMSKSLGNVVSPFDLLEKYEPDSVRYCLLRNGGLVNDADFSIAALETRRNDDLANTWCNLVMRCLAKGILPYDHWPTPQTTTPPDAIAKSLRALPGRVDKCFSEFEFAKGINLILDVLYATNSYFQDAQPWVALKKIRENEPESDLEALRAEVDTTVFWTLESIRVCSILLLPITPTTSNKILDTLGVTHDERTFQACMNPTLNPAARPVNRPLQVLFPKQID